MLSEDPQDTLLLPDHDEYVNGNDLVFAARTGDYKTVEQLLTAGVPASFHNTRNGTSDWTALKWAASEGHEDVLTLLLEYNAAQAEADNDSKTETGQSSGTPLHWAAYKGHVRLVWRLLTAKPNFSAKDVDSELNTPLHVAAAAGHLEVIKTMLGQGVDVNIKNIYGNIPLQLSTSGPCRELLREAAAAAKEGRYYLCACSGIFCSEKDSVADVVIDAVSVPNKRPVRYTESSAQTIRSAEDALTQMMKGNDVHRLEATIAAACSTGASLPMITTARASLERLKAQIALGDVVNEVQAARPLTERTLPRKLHAPLKAAQAAGVAASMIAEAISLLATVEAEITLADMIAGGAGLAPPSCALLFRTDPQLHMSLRVVAVAQPLKMGDPVEYEEGAAIEPPSADDESSMEAEAMIAKLAYSITQAHAVEAMELVCWTSPPSAYCPLVTPSPAHAAVGRRRLVCLFTQPSPTSLSLVSAGDRCGRANPRLPFSGS